MKVTVREFLPDPWQKEYEKRMRRITVRLAEAILKLHRDSIRGNYAPNGGPQKQNSPGWKARKHGKPPLENTGTLLRDTKFHRNRKGLAATIRPPVSRREAMEYVHEKGYSSIWNTPFVLAEAQKIVDESMRGIPVKTRTKTSG